MADFNNWCVIGASVHFNGHEARVLTAIDDSAGIATLIDVLPSAYAKTESLAVIAERFGKDGVAKFFRNKLPTKANARSGDVGEILATAYLNEECQYVVGPSRLIQRDHQEWAMRGDDVLGARRDGSGQLCIVKVEAKSRLSMGVGTVNAARAGLARNDEMPSPHSLTQFAERLLSTPDSQIGYAVLEMQLLDGVRPEVVDHLMFLFTESDPSAHVESDLNAYAGRVSQLTITLRVADHQRFIGEAYEGVTTGGS